MMSTFAAVPTNGMVTINNRENIRGKTLLIKVVHQGKIIYHSPSLDKIREYLKINLACLPAGLRSANAKQKYHVVISPQLKNLRRVLARQLEERQ